MEKALGGLQARLSNSKFVDNAAPAVVEEVKQQQVRALYPRLRLGLTSHGQICLEQVPRSSLLQAGTMY